MIIGVDIDGVLSDDDRYRLDHYPKYCYLHGLKPMDYPYAYEDKCSEWTHEIFEDYVNEFQLTYYKEAAMFTYADEITQKLHEEGHKIIIITGRHIALEDSPRGKYAREETENWLNNHHIYYDKLVFSTFPKTESMWKNNIDLMIEDFPKTIEQCRTRIPTICFDNRYNVGYQAENVYRAFSWYDIYRIIHQFTDQK